MTNTIGSRICEDTNAATNTSSTPSSSAPTIAPFTLPNPPRIAPVMALDWSVPNVGYTVYFTPRNTPPTPASRPAMPNTVMISTLELMPISSAV